MEQDDSHGPVTKRKSFNSTVGTGTVVGKSDESRNLGAEVMGAVLQQDQKGTSRSGRRRDWDKIGGRSTYMTFCSVMILIDRLT